MTRIGIVVVVIEVVALLLLVLITALVAGDAGVLLVGTAQGRSRDRRGVAR